MKIKIKKHPANPTGVKPGQIMGYNGSLSRLIVVGEDDLCLHTFILGSGIYCGVRKRRENLKRLVQYKSMGDFVF